MSDGPISLDKWKAARDATPTTGARLENGRVVVTTECGELTSDAARVLACTILQLADEADGKDGGFGYDPNDSRELRTLRDAIDDHLGWETPREEEGGDYVKRVAQVAQDLTRRPALRPVPNG